MDIFEAMRKEGLSELRIVRGVGSSSKLHQEALRLLEETGEYDHEEVAFFFDIKTELKAIIAIHDSTLGKVRRSLLRRILDWILRRSKKGKSLGGTRILSYLTPEEKENGIIVPGEVITKRAMFDVLRLSQGMTYKSAMAGLNLGGAKGVIIADPDREKRPVLLWQYGKCVNTFKGRFITGEDMNIKIPDADIISFATPYVVGLSPDNPRRRGGGDPSPFTGRGVFQGQRAALEEKNGTDSFESVRDAIQGIAGGVGSNLARLLHEAGARLIGSGGEHVKKTKEICKELGAKVIEDRERIYDVECDIFSPNAGGGILNDETIPRLKCKIVAGGANNQLLKPEHGDLLHKLGILYIPDYVINAGGLINVYNEIVEGGYDLERSYQMVDNIYNTVKEIIRVSKEKNLPTYLVAEEMAKERIRKGTINQAIPRIKLS